MRNIWIIWENRIEVSMDTPQFEFFKQQKYIIAQIRTNGKKNSVFAKRSGLASKILDLFIIEIILISK
jgi:hypothetical protein